MPNSNYIYVYIPSPSPSHVWSHRVEFTTLCCHTLVLCHRDVLSTPFAARLSPFRTDVMTHGWVPQAADANPWLQIDLGTPRNVWVCQCARARHAGLYLHL